MGEHRIDVIRIDRITKHTNADTLGLVQVYGFTCAVKLDQFKPGDLAVYIEPDFVVPDAPQFAFLGSSKRMESSNE